MTNHVTLRLTPLAALAVVGLFGPAGALGQVVRPVGPAEQVGEVVGGALDTAGRAVEGALRTAFARTRGAVEAMELTPRVYSRLLWDKELAGARLAVDAHPGGVIVLRGSVLSQAQADRAVELAASTVGVSRVISELVAPEPAVGPPRSSSAVPGPEPLPEVGPGAEIERPAPLPAPLPRPAPPPGLQSTPAPDSSPEPSLSVQPPLP
ncbi:BON domain-containing protein [Tautonia sociabilis]|uniref:BON domain-containing protein n=1 Tax=Tautonia sociabilis TaxID=2080755 RepID=A0A432MK31_9BACT|nr:BON domain-containing protein [Tautonia sociabilis]RUL87762.1 BON domain-containing protein [Tautonia sociabilis]